MPALEPPWPVDTDPGIDAVREITPPEPPEPVDTDSGISAVPEIPPPLPSPLGAGHLILVVRELSGLSQRSLARAVGTSQPTLATLETGNRTPTIRTLMRVADATGFELVIGLRRPDARAPDPDILHTQGFDLLGTLRPDPRDGLADFVVLREPSPFEGPR
jgi:transcriptional regulator with XRE-family HTH domain